VDRGRYVLVMTNEPGARPARPEEIQAGKDRREKSRRAKKAVEVAKEKEPEAAKESDAAR
jgi:hypothetical protein